MSGDVFLTGGTGFIGKHFLKQLNQLGRNVRCMTRSSSSVDSIRNFDCDAERRVGVPTTAESSDARFHFFAGSGRPKQTRSTAGRKRSQQSSFTIRSQ